MVHLFEFGCAVRAGWGMGDGESLFAVWTLQRRDSREPEGCTKRFRSEARSASAYIVNIDEVTLKSAVLYLLSTVSASVVVSLRCGKNDRRWL